MKKLLVIILAMVMVLTMFGGCVEQPTNTGDPNEIVASGKKIKVGVMNIAACSIANYRADKEGYFKDSGLEVEVLEFSNGVLMNEAFAAGAIDIGLNGFAAAYSMSTGEYTYLSDVCVVKGHGIWVRPDSPLLKVKGEFNAKYPEIYGSKDTAKGLKMFCQLGAITQILVDSYMSGLGNTDYKLIGMDVGASLNALIAGEGDAAVLYPPYSSQAKEAGLVEIGQYDEICGGKHNEVLMCSNEMYQKRYGDVVLFMRALYKAAAEIQADDDIFYADGMKFFAESGAEYSDKDMRQLMGMRDFFTSEMLTAEDYEYGYHLSFTIVNLQRLGKLGETAMDEYKKSIAPKALKDALEIDVKIGYYE